MSQRYEDHKRELVAKHGEYPCPFCITIQKRVYITETATMLVVENDYPYEYFDGRYVQQHYMIIPRRHIALIGDFTAQESHEYWQLIAQYHHDGYSVFTRSATDDMRSVPQHLHTHLFMYDAEATAIEYA